MTIKKSSRWAIVCDGGQRHDRISTLGYRLATQRVEIGLGKARVNGVNLDFRQRLGVLRYQHVERRF